jgi:hypothetical protein
MFSKKPKFGFEEIDDHSIWIYWTRSFGRSDVNALDIPLHQLLMWITEQISIGCWSPIFDENGDGIALVIGEEAPHQMNMEEAKEYASTRHAAINLSHLVALKFEGGAFAEDESLLAALRESANNNSESTGLSIDEHGGYHPANAWKNMEICYALRLLPLLERIRRKLFDLPAPPIQGKLSDKVCGLLSQATLAHYFELNASSVAMCRVLLEEALRSRTDERDLSEYQQQRRASNCGTGELECMINLAYIRRLITSLARSQAHKIRILGNRILHGNGDPSDEETRQTLLNARSILDELSV